MVLDDDDDDDDRYPLWQSGSRRANPAEPHTIALGKQFSHTATIQLAVKSVQCGRVYKKFMVCQLSVSDRLQCCEVKNMN